MGGRSDNGLLIVNADDWGGERAATDAILECFEARAITSTTAMVHMDDSERAARIAAERDLSVGLHINLTLPYSDPSIPEDVRARQLRLVEAIGSTPAHRAWRPLAPRTVCACVSDQLTEFERLYGRPPTHVDGHNHIHVSPMVMFARALPERVMARRTINWPTEAGLSRSLVRAARSLSARQLSSPSYLASIREVHPALGGRELDPLLDLAERETVEIMVHPQWDDERAILLSDEWSRTLAGRPLGSFADLARTAMPDPVTTLSVLASSGAGYAGAAATALHLAPPPL